MKLKLAILLALMFTDSLAAIAATAETRHDTVQIYNSWQAIFSHNPDTVAINPRIKANSPFDFKIEPEDKAMRKMMRELTVAVTVGDTLWLISSDWIKRNFHGDCGAFSRFMPLYFSNKIAFVQFRRNRATVGGYMLNGLVTGLTGMDMGVGMGDGYNGRPPKFYLLDFASRQVRKVDKKLLLELLERYPDMKRGYQWGKHADETYMVNEYFMLYAERLSQDAMSPELF